MQYNAWAFSNNSDNKTLDVCFAKGYNSQLHRMRTIQGKFWNFRLVTFGKLLGVIGQGLGKWKQMDSEKCKIRSRSLFWFQM